MKKYLFTLLFVAAGLFPRQAEAFSFNPNNIISDSTFVDRFSMNLDSVQSFLGRGFLSTYETFDFAGEKKSAAEIIYESSQRYGINPKVLLVLLQKEQSLITEQDPTEKQLDWATGYAVCDDCAMDDPRIARWKGFGKQVNSAAAQFIDGYLADIEEDGTAYGKYGPGVPLQVSGQTVIPENAATAALYAYTPHISGNKLFASLWDQWFSVNHPDGALMKSAERPEVYYIQNGTKRHITSYSVLVSRFDESLITIVSQSTIDSIPTGIAIQYPNYSLLMVNGGRFLIVDDTVRPFDSEESFRKFGFQEDELIDASYDDLEGYTYGDTITKYTQYPTGRLVKITESGSYYYLEDGYRFYLNPALLNMQFKRYPVYKVASTELTQLRDGGLMRMGNGYLVKAAESPDVYLMSDGKKRKIDSESAFAAFGWSASNIITVDAEFLNLHANGELITDAE